MNKSKIDWCDHTWNPITGCHHQCPYCYARTMTKRFSGDIKLNLAEDRHRVYENNSTLSVFILDEPFPARNGRILPYPFGFAPTYHRYRLDAPSKKLVGCKIFVGAMADVFGSWIPEEWILEIFEACRQAPQHQYIFLTKNPKRYVELASKGLLPRETNFWYGSTITKVNDPMFTAKEYNTFLSIEPLLEPMLNKELMMGVVGTQQWIIIGAETGKRKDKVRPDTSWFMPTVEAAKELGVPVFYKESLSDIVGAKNMIQEFPESMTVADFSKKQETKLYTHCGMCKKNKKKSQMTAILGRAGRGESAIAIGYICDDCFEDFKKGFEK